MRHFLSACVLALASLGGANAQSPEPLSFALGAEEARYMPLAGPAHSRQISHLVWDAEAGVLARQNFEIIDRFGEADLEVTWEPRLAGDGAVRPNGEGRLTWRQANTAHYDTGAIVAIYEGSLREGALNGSGWFWHRAGLSYRGEFAGGVFSGQGQLQMPGGDFYRGAFRDGLYHGVGRLVTASGSVHEGAFRRGLAHGAGQASPAKGRAFASVWRGGEEVLAERKALAQGDPLAHLQRIQAISHPDAILGISLNHHLPDDVSPEWVTLYEGVNDGQLLRVQPGDAEMMAQWLGKSELPVMGPYDSGHFYFDRFQPVSFAVALDYSGTNAMGIAGGYVAVESSRTIGEPAIELRRDTHCGNVSGEMNIANHVDVPFNDGNVQFRVSGGSSWGQAQSIKDEGFGMSASPIAAVAAAGVDVQWLSENRPSCQGGDAGACLDQVKASGRYGSVANLIYGDGPRVLMNVEGRLQYSYVDGDGQAVSVERLFTVPVKIGEVIEDRGECGAEGGEPLNFRKNPFVFEPKGSNYRLPFNLTDTVAAGTRRGWLFQFDAPVSSQHRFQVFLQLADGRTVATREVDLTYFKHRTQPEDW